MAKKKHRGQDQQKLQKQQQAQYRNIFMSKLKTLCAQIGDVSLYSKIPESEKTAIYAFRGAPLKIEVAKGSKIQKRLVEVLGKTIKKQLLSMQMEVVKGSGQMMSYADYFSVGMSLEYNLESENANYNKEGFEKFVEGMDERTDAYCDGIESICRSTCMIFDDISKTYLYTYKFEIDTKASHPGFTTAFDRAVNHNQRMKAFTAIDFRVLQKVIIDAYPLDVRKVNIDGEVRPVIQLGFLLHENSESIFYPFSISSEDLRMKNSFSKLPIPVYIQQHALHRLKERTGCAIPSMRNIILQLALLHKKILPLKGNRMLIACFVEKLKLGYLLAELIDGIVIIRTFLLLTNSGTPEGNRLAKLTGLQVDDFKYLSIDNLQGLANSDIEQNESICNIFRAAGCGDILELCKKMRTEPSMMWLLDPSHPKNTISELISEYLAPGANNDEYVEEDQI
jgi:hypothetical protein